MIQESSTDAESALGLRHKLSLSLDTSAPLVFLVHGRAGNFDVMWTFRRCLPDNCSVIAPQAPLLDPVGGYSWWQVREKFDLRANEQMLDNFANFLTLAPTYYGLAPRKVVALGFSQGGALLSMIAQRNRDLLTTFGLLASFAIPLVEEDKSGFQGDIFISHGNEDEIVPVAKAERSAQFFRNLGFNVEFYVDPVGHKVGTQGMRELKRWVAERLSS